MFRWLRTLIRDNRGVVAMEFALVLPLMIPLWFVGYEIAQDIRANMQLQSTAAAIADLVAQQSAGVSSGTGGSLGNFCNAGRLMMTPFATAGTFSVAVASVSNYSGGGVQVDWESDNACPTPAPPLGGAAVTLATSPTNLLPNAGSPGDSVIVVRATYLYQSALQYLLPFPITLTQTVFARPRGNVPIPCNGC